MYDREKTTNPAPEIEAAAHVGEYALAPEGAVIDRGEEEGDMERARR